MDDLTIAVTGAGGPAGIAVIQALPYTTIAMDADPHAAGFHLADHHQVIARADDPKFVASLLSVIEKYQPDVLVSTVCEEFGVLEAMGTYLHKFDCKVWLPSQESVARCLDKAIFATILHDAGIFHPPTALDTSEPIPGPWIIKPRRGRGSRDIRQTATKLSTLVSFHEGDIIQTQIAGREFTADCLAGYDGTLLGCFPRWRLETRGGISVKGETFLSDNITVACKNVVDAMQSTGPLNIQGFVTDDDQVVVIECNPRFSGGLPLTIAAGANLPVALVHMTLDPTFTPRLSFKPGVYMTRYFTDIFEGA